MTSVECERIFSNVNLILTRLRNCLSISKLNFLIMLARNGPPIDKKDMIPVIKLWKEEKKRYFL